jgi:predicted phage tail protein
VPTDYVLEAGTAPGQSDAATVRVGNVTTFSADVSSGTYYVRVRAENAYGDSDPTEDLEVRAPGGPQNPSGLVDYGSGSVVDLRWNASSGGFAPTGYVIEAGSASGLSDLATLVVGNVTRFVTTAPPGVYYVRVRAINGSGPSGPSNEIVVRK